jgi:quercetin dioxygenase-like cupin family protein
MDRARSTAAPAPRLIALDVRATARQPVLEGPPGTVTMRSGLVTLDPGESVGRHSTGGYEELLVVLAGAGELRFATHDPLRLVSPCAAYCPPDTEHEVVNTGTAALSYVYVVARAPREAV